MKRLLPLLLAGTTAMPLAAQGVARVDPRLLLARRLAVSAPALARPVAPGEAGVQGQEAVGATRAPLPGLAPLASDAQGRVWLRTLARVAPGGERALEQAGARLGARAGDVLSALVPLDAFDRVAASPGLVYLEAATELRTAVEPLPSGRADVAGDRGGRGAVSGPGPRPGPGPSVPMPASAGIRAVAASPTNDTGIGDSDVEGLRQREDDFFYGVAGQHVVVGIYDSGIHLTHPDFRGAIGPFSRVRWAWDQSVSGGGPGTVGSGTYLYGRDCTQNDIASGACPMKDRHGHGSHVAGTAAGSGRATGKGMPAYRFTGVAPVADLVVVKGGDNAFTSDKLVDGVAYIFERARQLGEPAVVNLSVETQNGPHDGSTNFERALDALSGPGRILAVAAGNAAVNANESPAFVRTPVHAGGRVGSGARAGVDMVVPAYTPVPGPNNDGAVLDLWYDGRDSLAVVVTTPGGARIRVPAGDTATFTSPDGDVVIDNASAGRNPNNGGREVMIVLVDLGAAAPAAGRWRFEVEGSAVAGSGRWDLWLVGSTLRTPTTFTSFDGPAVRNATLVAVPGTATRAITVAAYASRHGWLTAGAKPQSYPFQEPLGDIAYFSDPGPRRDGVLKPEIAAPGKVVVSSRSKDETVWAALPSYVEADSVHAVLLGTSMATPFVTGALALLLQLRPTLTPEDARALLTASARRDAFTVHPYTGEPDGTPNAQWGYGKLDVAAAVRRLSPPAGSLRVEVTPDPRPGSPTSARGTRLELLRLTLAADSAEAEQVTQLGFDVTGRDTAASLIVVRDVNGDGVAAADEPVVARAPVRLDSAAVRVTVSGPVVPAGLRRDYVVALELSGAVPNGARFRAAYRPADLRARGTLSGVANTVAPTGSVGSELRSTTLLLPGETLNLSQNPIRFAPLVINYAERPRAIYVYALTGVRVRTLSGAALEDGRALWPLDNDRGQRVANGMYLLVIDAPTGAIRRKLFVAR